MTAPRQVLPGTVYLVTRRCSERRFFLRPSKTTTAIFRYLLAYAAEKTRVRVHAFCVLSNHVHLLVTDPDARLPDFNRILNGLVARATNCQLGRWESFWDPDSYSAGFPDREKFSRTPRPPGGPSRFGIPAKFGVPGLERRLPSSGP